MSDFIPHAADDAPVGKVRRCALHAAGCPSRAVLAHLTSRWGVLAMIRLLDGTYRFSQLRREIGGVSEKMLAQTLDALVRDGLVLRKDYRIIPPKVEYSLTPMGSEAAEQLLCLADWIETNFERICAARVVIEATKA